MTMDPEFKPVKSTPEKPSKRVKTFLRFESGYYEVVDVRHENQISEETFVTHMANNGDYDQKPRYETGAMLRMVEIEHVIFRTQDKARAERVLGSLQNDG